MTVHKVAIALYKLDVCDVRRGGRRHDLMDRS